MLKLKTASPRGSAWSLDKSGSTGIFALVDESMVVVGNVGDSRAIISSVSGNEEEGLISRPLSTDHKPTVPSERQRILKAKGLVSRGRVNGMLAVSRAFGDFTYKGMPGNDL